MLELVAPYPRFRRSFLDAADEHAPRPDGMVPWTELWMVADSLYVGRISVRHELTELLLRWGGGRARDRLGPRRL